jgi:hypothetical protein
MGSIDPTDNVCNCDWMGHDRIGAHVTPLHLYQHTYCAKVVISELKACV